MDDESIILCNLCQVSQREKSLMHMVGAMHIVYYYWLQSCVSHLSLSHFHSHFYIFLLDVYS